jgi:hypothetical protein
MLHSNQKENMERICSNPKCNELGVYPAPKSRDQLREYLYFCINCIRDFNKSWNYFEGLNEQELEIEIRKSTTWNRPSWKFGTKNLNYDFEKAFRQFNDQKKLDENKNVSKKIKDAFNLLDLDLNSTPDEIKRRYKNLAKKWHPDVQQNETNHNKNKFIDITNAYKTILDSFTEK